MKATQLFKRSILASAMVASVVAGTLWAQTSTTQTATPQPTTAAANEGVVAVVNGVPISSKWFNDLLMSVAGVRVFPQALDLILVQQECARNSIPMQGEAFQKKVQAEIDLALDALEAQGVAHDQRGKLMAQLLARSGRTEQEFLITMNIQAGLRALSAGRLGEITDKERAEGFKAIYGPKVKIEVMTFKTMEDAVAAKNDIAGGKDLYRATQEKGGQVQSMTISENAEQEELKKIKESAFALEPKKMSAVISQNLPNGALYQVVYLDEKVPAQNVKEADVRDKVEKALINIKEQNWMTNMMRQLQQNVRVEIKDPILSQQYEAIVKNQQAATQATQPATRPATRPAK